MHKFVKFVTKTNSKIFKLLTYNKKVNNPIYSNKQKKGIDKKFLNINLY